MLMKPKTINKTLIYNLAASFILLASLCAQAFPTQSIGSLQVTAINGDGNHIPNATVDVCTSYPAECRYSGKTDTNGVIIFSKIPEGIYNVEIKASGIPIYIIGQVRIEANKEQDLGRRTLGIMKNMCLSPGVDCLIDTSVSAPNESVCLKDYDYLRSDNGSRIVIEYEELQRRAIKSADPQWPKDAMPGYATSVLVLIGIDGRVKCFVDKLKNNSMNNAIIVAARKWHFQPILHKGLSTPAVGILEFQVPYSFSPK
jgi:hypothetical protein